MALLDSHKWLDKIVAILFEPETRRLDRLVSVINAKNAEYKGKACYGFMHMGEVYVPSEHVQSFRAVHGRRGASNTVPTLAIQLMDEARDFMSEVNKIKLDKDQIRQILFKLIYQANTLQELRDAIPDCVAALLPELKDKHRFMPEPTYLHPGDDRIAREYERMLPKMELYAMTRLLY